jgi:hypothetical protein
LFTLFNEVPRFVMQKRPLGWATENSEGVGRNFLC